MLNIKKYGSSSEDESDDTETNQFSNEALLTHLKPVDPSLSVAKTMQVCAAPAVVPTVRNINTSILKFSFEKFCLCCLF